METVRQAPRAHAGRAHPAGLLLSRGRAMLRKKDKDLSGVDAAYWRQCELRRARSVRGARQVRQVRRMKIGIRQDITTASLDQTCASCARLNEARQQLPSV